MPGIGDVTLLWIGHGEGTNQWLRSTKAGRNYHPSTHSPPAWSICFYEQDTSPIHQMLIIGHELGHLLAGHRPAAVLDPDVSKLLLPDLDARVAQTADGLAEQAGLADDDRLATIEAAQLAFGLRAHRAGVPATQPQPADTPPRPADGYAGEVTWLTRVAIAYHQSPVVAATLDATGHLTATDTRSQPIGDPRQ